MEDNIAGTILDVAQLGLDGDFYSQMDTLLTHVRLSREQVESLSVLFEDLKYTLAEYWPNCKVFVFGSIVTGLGLKTSDVDIYCEIPPQLKPLPPICITKAKKLLMKDPGRYQKIFAIKHAKVPILSFYHVGIGVSCDLSFSSKDGARNSDIIAFLFKLDNRVLPLAILIKYWSKVHKLCGTNLLSNYSLVIMIIFYLQQKKILPTLETLLQGPEGANQNDDSLWDYRFSEENIPLSENTDSIHDLLGGFFKYYRDFNFKDNVVSIYTGYPIERSKFDNVDSVPEIFERYIKNIREDLCAPLKTNTKLCIQDVIQHNRNCAVSVHNRLLQNIEEHIALAAHIYEECCNTDNYDYFIKGMLIQHPSQFNCGLQLPVRKKKRHQTSKNRAKNKAKALERAKSYMHQHNCANIVARGLPIKKMR